MFRYGHDEFDFHDLVDLVGVDLAVCAPDRHGFRVDADHHMVAELFGTGRGERRIRGDEYGSSDRGRDWRAVLVILMETFTSLRWTALGGKKAVYAAANVFGIQWALRISAAICFVMVLMVFFGVRGQGAGSTHEPCNAPQP